MEWALLAERQAGLAQKRWVALLQGAGMNNSLQQRHLRPEGLRGSTGQPYLPPRPKARDMRPRESPPSARRKPAPGKKAKKNICVEVGEEDPTPSTFTLANPHHFQIGPRRRADLRDWFSRR